MKNFGNFLIYVVCIEFIILEYINKLFINWDKIYYVNIFYFISYIFKWDYLKLIIIDNFINVKKCIDFLKLMKFSY